MEFEVIRLLTTILLCLIIISGIASCSGQSSSEIQGYIEGRYTYIATSVSGIIRELKVDRGSIVKTGSLLFILEQQPEKDIQDAAAANLEQSYANKKIVNANLYYTKNTYQRNKVLAPSSVSIQTYQQSTSNYNANLAQLAQADAEIATNMADLARATWTLNQKTVPAPVDGIVFQKYYRLGEYSEAGKPILSILAPEDIKLIFYVREPMLSKINLDDAVSVRCDECKKSYTAHISFISPRAEYTPPVIFSDQTNAKLIYRIEARFAMDDAYKMHPGQPMMVELKKHA